jgi:hypothetical protein
VEPADVVASAGAPEAGDPLERLWGRLARPYSAASTISAVTGLSRPAVGELVGTVLATSREAEEVLAAFPRSIRSLATSMGAQAERCIGELRGPVLWSETLSARASSFGDPDLYICATPRRAYDVDENRVLVAALVTVREAARAAVEHIGGEARYEDPTIREAIHNGSLAARFVEHPSLADVSRRRPTGRALRRARSGKKRSTYAPAVRMLDRAAEPLDAAAVRSLCDRRTRAQHEVLLAVVDRLESTGGQLPGFRAERGALFAGPVQYRHPARAAELGGRSGITVGQVLLDVPWHLAETDRDRATAELAARAGDQPHRVVLEPGDVDEAVDLAIALAVSGPDA